MRRLTLILLGVFLMFTAACGDGGVDQPPEATPTPTFDATPEPTPTVGGGAQNPQVTIEMDDGGQIVLELYPDKAPNTVNNFLKLARDGYYDGIIFHRVISNFMIQGGDPEGTGLGGPGYMVKGEMTAVNPDNDISHVRGVLSMARRGAQNPDDDHLYYDTAGSQFFIVVEDSTFLDEKYTAFGKVIDGMDVVDRIKNARTDENDRPKSEKKMKKVTVETFGVEYPEPETIAE